jgi:glycerol uptake facilitator-like aquaporin
LLNPAVTIGIQLSAFLSLGTISVDCFIPCLGLIIAQFLGGILSQKFFRKVYLYLMRKWKKKIGDE